MGAKKTSLGTKKLDSSRRADYHSPIQGQPHSGCTYGTEGPARQLWPATLARPPPRGVNSWRAYYSAFLHACMHLFLLLNPS